MNWDEVRKEFETTKISLADLAAKYDIKYPTIKSRKQRQKWTKKDASKNASLDASKNIKDASKKKPGGQPGNGNAKGHGAPKGNDNAKGNNGGAPKGNQNSRTHGLYSNFIPPEDINIVANAKQSEGLFEELAIAKYKLASLLRFQTEKDIIGNADYEELIQKQIKLIAMLEEKIHGMQSSDQDKMQGNIQDMFDSLNKARKERGLV